MALWRIVVKNSGNAACKDKRQRIEKGMFIETSTVSPIPPIGVSRERPMLAQLFLNKYGIEVNANNMNSNWIANVKWCIESPLIWTLIVCNLISSFHESRNVRY